MSSSAETTSAGSASSRATPEAFSHLIDSNGSVTIIGFGSLVSLESARSSFEFRNFRLGTVRGYQRIFNRSDWINISWGDTRIATGETSSLAFAYTGSDTISTIALMDIDAEEGLRGFLHRETAYEIVEVPFVDSSGNTGIGLACGECSDSRMREIWGDDCWYLQRCSGKISFVDLPEGPIPLVPELEVSSPSGEIFIGGDPTQLLSMDQELCSMDVIRLPDRTWIYPAPGYLRLVCRAHRTAGILDEFLDTTLLMDRKTTVRSYLFANSLLNDWVMDPELHDYDRYG
jgi:hypothetical protein